MQEVRSGEFKVTLDYQEPGEREGKEREGQTERNIEICRERTEQMEDTEERKLSRIMKTRFPIQTIYKA